MMIEFCCRHCGHVKLEPAELHEDPRNAQTCTACAVRLCKPLAPPPTVEWIRPSKAERKLLEMLCWVGLVAFGFAMGFFVRGGS